MANVSTVFLFKIIIFKFLEEKFQTNSTFVELWCVFWRWFDPPICPRSRQIIPSLLRMINELEAQVSVLEQQDHGNGKGFSMWKLLFVSLMVLLLCIVLCDKNSELSVE